MDDSRWTRLWARGRLPALLAAAVSGCAAPDPHDEVVRVLERRCANPSCHGATEDFAATDPHLDPQRWLTLVIDEDGRIVDREGALASATAKVSAENPRFSSLLRKTIPVRAGGLYHFRSSAFPNGDDPDFRTLAAWVDGAGDGTEGASEPPLDANEQLFASEVYPFLVQRGCATATCHGSLGFGGARFRAPAIPGTFELPRAELRATYLEARSNLSLWGKPERSRLLAKIIPLERGGIPHKGGNDVFFANEAESGVDPLASDAAKHILGWLTAERESALGDDAPPAALDPPIIAVAGPIPTAGPFDIAPYTPGTNLLRLDPPYGGAPTNLTNAPATADVRDPAVSHDGKTVVFSMRTSAADAHNLYTIGIDGTGLRQLTFDAAGSGRAVVGNFAPVFGPSGGFVSASGEPPPERIYFSSARGDPSDLASVQNADLYAIDVDGSNPERLTYTVVPEIAPTFLAAGEFAGTMAYTIRRSADVGFKGVLFRFPIDHNRDFHLQPEAHPHFGISEPPRVFHRLRELPDGRAAVVLLDEANRWRGGQLALLERQFGVEIPEGQEGSATLPGFRHALTILTPEASREKLSPDGAWLDPTPMPDGTLLVAHAAGPLDLADARATLHPAILRISLASDRATSRPAVAAASVLWSDPSMPLSQPVAAYARPPEDPPHPRKWDTSSPTATLAHAGAQVIEAVLAQLPPTAPRAVRADIALVRAVAPVSAVGAVVAAPVPASETRDGHAEATSLSLTGRMPLFVAAELPPAADGSLAAELPAKLPVRIVTLDADHVATGALHHHWYAPLPAERFPVGIPLTSFGASCAGCHGAMDGEASSVLTAPTDFITQASVTAALYADSDRRRPLALPTVDTSSFRFVDFRRHVEPILDAKCATSGCHTGASPAGGLSLSHARTPHYTDAYESLLARGDGSASGYRYVDADGARARGSHLAERVLGREYDAPRALGRACPPDGSPALTAEEKTTLVRWIELGATFVGEPEGRP